MRVAICGHPGTGKTTLAELLARGVGGAGRVLHTDDTLDHGWEAAAASVAGWFDDPGPLVVEGLRVPCALLVWRGRNPGAPPPVDRVVVLERNYLYKSRLRLGDAHDQSLAAIAAWLGGRLERR